MKNFAYTFAILFHLTAITCCSQTNKNPTNDNKPQADRQNIARIDSAAMTPVSRFSVPAGYRRLTYEKNSFQYYLSNFPLKSINAKVYYYNGNLKSDQSVSSSVLDIDVGKKDLQQCADAVIRLRAEYLYQQKRFSDIHFNFTNGFSVDYPKWATGYRIKISGNTASWYKAVAENYSYNSFKEYLDIVFAYAGTLSLNKELNKVSQDSIQVGDVFIHGGSPGHAVIVIDMAVNTSSNKRIFMIAQSYMPAQNIHMLVNENNKEISPWYDLSQADKLYSPEWTFEKTDLKRFNNR